MNATGMHKKAPLTMLTDWSPLVAGNKLTKALLLSPTTVNSAHSQSGNIQKFHIITVMWLVGFWFKKWSWTARTVICIHRFNTLCVYDDLYWHHGYDILKEKRSEMTFTGIIGMTFWKKTYFWWPLLASWVWHFERKQIWDDLYWHHGYDILKENNFGI